MYNKTSMSEVATLNTYSLMATPHLRYVQYTPKGHSRYFVFDLQLIEFAKFLNRQNQSVVNAFNMSKLSCH